MKIKVRVKTGCKQFSVQEKGYGLFVCLTEQPKEGKANTELVKELKKYFKKEVLPLRRT